MDKARWEKIQKLFEEAINLNETEKTRFLKENCGNDESLFREVLTLLEEDKEIHPILNSKASNLITESEEKLNFVGQQIGNYKLVEEIASGGMGTVFLAERNDGAFEQRVALKIIKPGLSTIPIIRRFQHERQILANLQHPNIAKLFDGGVTEDRRPFFTMEYVEGIPIDEYCDENKLSVNERLKLFIQVCHTVQYAHNNLVVHRDLKPSNILIQKNVEIKLLDFGISKVLTAEEGNSDLPTITQTEINLLTPEYSSPEQIKNSKISVSTDVYSLGLVLYKLLTGKSAHEFKTRTFSEYEKVVCEKTISRPSTILNKIESFDENTNKEIFKSRNTHPGKLKKTLSGDLDNICMMALRKEPERRYVSAEMLAYDIERYLNNLPILARKESLYYTSKKFILRHKAPVITAIVLFFVVNGLILFYTIKLKEERDKANLEAKKSEQVASFLQNLFFVADPSESKGETITARELLDIGSKRLKRELNTEPEIKSKLLNTIGQVYTNLGLYKSAEDIFNEVKNSPRLKNIDKKTYIETLINLGSLYRIKGEYKLAGDILQKTLDQCKQNLGVDNQLVGECYLNLGGYCYETGDFKNSRIYYNKAGKIFTQGSNPSEERIAQVAHDIGVLEFDEGNLDRADSLFRKALRIKIKLHGEINTDVAAYQMDLASALRHEGKYKEAKEIYEKVLSTQIKLLGEDHPDVALTLNHLSRLYYNQEKFKEAEPLARKSLEIRLKNFPEDHPEVSASRSSLAGDLMGEKKYKEAEKLYRLAYKSSLEKLGENHPYTPAILGNIGNALMEQKKYKEAEECFTKSIKKLKQLFPESQNYVVGRVNSLADLYIRTGRYKKSEHLLREELSMLKNKDIKDGWLVGLTESLLGYSLFKQSKNLEAEGLLINGYNVIRDKKGKWCSESKKALQRIIDFYKSKKREDKVKEFLTLQKQN